MKRISSSNELHKNRRGIAILWLILWGSMFLTFFCVVLEIATLWQAHVEINNTLDSTALAAAKKWGANTLFDDTTQVPRNVGVTFAAANPVLGNTVVLNPNFQNGNTNGNLDVNGELVFGGISSLSLPNSFNPGANTDLLATLPAVRVRKTIQVQGFCSSILGVSFPVSGSSVAYLDKGTRRAALVSLSP